MLRGGRAVLAVLVLGAAACGSSDDVVEVNRNEAVPVQLAVILKGDVSVSFAETVTSRFIVRRTKDKNEDLRKAQIVGVEPIDPIKFGNGAFLAGVGVVHFDGDGTYTIPEGSPMDAVTASKETGLQPEVTSSVKVDWWPTGQIEDAPETFLRRAKPCRVVVKNQGTQGTVTCPDVTNEKRDKHFAMTLSWTAPTTPAVTTSTGGT